MNTQSEIDRIENLFRESPYGTAVLQRADIEILLRAARQPPAGSADAQLAVPVV